MIRERYEVQRARKVIDQSRPGRLDDEQFRTETKTVKIAGWSQPKTEELPDRDYLKDAVVRTIYHRPGTLQGGDSVTFPGESIIFTVDGEPKNFDHGPFGWSPGWSVSLAWSNQAETTEGKQEHGTGNSYRSEDDDEGDGDGEYPGYSYGNYGG